MGTPLLEIAIPTFERESVVFAVRSALAVKSAYPTTHIRVYNNGRPDPLAHRLRSCEVEIVQNEHNLGMVGNWNRALQGAAGDYLILLHDDDELRPERTVEALGAFAGCGDAAFLFSAVRVTGGNGRSGRLFVPFAGPRHFLPPRGALELVRAAVPVKAPGVILRRERVASAGVAFDGRFGYAADVGFYLALALRYPVMYWPLPSADYAMDATSTTYREMFVPRDVENLAALRDALSRDASIAGIPIGEWARGLNRWTHRHAVVSALFRLWKGDRESALRCLDRAVDLAGGPPWAHRFSHLLIRATARTRLSRSLYPVARWLCGWGGRERDPESIR